MKKLMLAFVMIFASGVASADTNQHHKECLELYGYTIEQFDTFDFRKASTCVLAKKQGEYEIWLARQRKDIEENPLLRVPGGYPYGHVSPSWGRNRIY